MSSSRQGLESTVVSGALTPSFLLNHVLLDRPCCVVVFVVSLRTNSLTFLIDIESAQSFQSRWLDILP